MATIEQLATAALNRESLRLRSLTQDLLRETSRLIDIPRPGTEDPRLLAAAASLVELFAVRLHQEPPAWAGEVGPLPEPIFLLAAAARLKRLRVLCEREAPEPLANEGSMRLPIFWNSLEPGAVCREPRFDL